MDISGLPDQLKSRLNVLGLEPLTRFRFAVDISGMTDIGNVRVPTPILSAGFNDIRGIKDVTDVREVREGGFRGVHSYPRGYKPNAITLIKGMTFSRFLRQWYLDATFWSIGQADYRRSVSIYMLSQINSPLGELPFEVYRFDAALAFPSGWDGPDLSSMSDEIAFESITLQHGGLSMPQSILGSGGEKVLDQVLL